MIARVMVSEPVYAEAIIAVTATVEESRATWKSGKSGRFLTNEVSRESADIAAVRMLVENRPY